MAATAEAPTPGAKKKYKFQVMGGAHWIPCKVIDPETGVVKVKDVPHGPRRPIFKDADGKDIGGDIVETDVDLARRFNRPNSLKYKPLDEAGSEYPIQLTHERARAESAENRYKRAIEKMTPRELIDHAADEGIDVKGETKKEPLIKLLLAAAGV